MQIKGIIYILSILFVLSLSSVGYARYNATDNSVLSSLKEQILELQRRTDEKDQGRGRRGNQDLVR